MPLFSTLDLFALSWFIFAWAAYAFTLAWTERRKHGLNSEMNRYRDIWMFQMLGRDMRMATPTSCRRCRTALRSSPRPR